MKILVEINLSDMSCRLLKFSNVSKRDMITLICNYFKISYSVLRKNPTSQKFEYVACRKFICYFLANKIEEEHITPYEIGRILGYKVHSTNDVKGDSTATIRRLINDIEEAIKIKDPAYLRSYENLNRLLAKISQ